LSFYGAPEENRLTTPITEQDHIRGRMDAPMTLLEYGDYECPACGAAYPLTETLIDAVGRDLCFAYRHFPLVNMHPHAEHAAEASEAAGVQRHFWDMHHVLFRNQHALEDEDLARYAATLHLNVKRFIEEIVEETYSDRIREDFRSGMRSGVNGTPTFFINGVRYDGPRDIESMVTVLNQGRQAPSYNQ
jgi:protein-disulfide isomerase